MITINKSNVQLINGNLVGEASTMGLEVGEVPDFIAVLDDRNEGYLFMNPQEDIQNGEVKGWNYTTKYGEHRLLVINT